MPTFSHFLRYWSLLASLAIVFSVYFIVIDNSVREPFNGVRYRIGMKKIVAYSLLKQIEMESEEYICNEQYRTNTANVMLENNNNTENPDGDTNNFKEHTWTHVGNSNLYISSVHVDQRWDPYHYVRIIGVVKGKIETNPICQFVTKASLYCFMKSTVKPIWYQEWDSNDTNQYYNPIMMSCRIPYGEKPNSVSIATKSCEITQSPTFKLKYSNQEIKRNFTVCVKPLDFREDISHHLIQWIEILKVLGADRIEFYVKKLKGETLNVLKWYTQQYPNFVRVNSFQGIPLKPTNNSSVFSKIWQKRRYEIVTYNNCFYRNFITSKFVIPLDIDEIIVPKISLTWNDLFEHIAHIRNINQYASFSAANTYFFSEKRKKKTIFFLENLLRSDYSPKGESGKSFINTQNTLTVFNHYALSTVPGVDRVNFLPEEWVQMNHYKYDCDIKLLPQCANYRSNRKILDSYILRLKNHFLLNYNKTLTELRKIIVL